MRLEGLILLIFGLLAGWACAPRSEAEQQIADAPIHIVYQGSEQELGCSVGELIDGLRGHAVFEWTVDVVPEGEGSWRLELRGVTQFDRAPNAWDIVLRPSSGTSAALVADRGTSQGDSLAADQLASMLSANCRQ